MSARAALCEIGDCGVLAVGRCGTCTRAFCGSHQASSRLSQMGVSWREADASWCVACMVQEQNRTYEPSPEQIADSQRIAAELAETDRLDCAPDTPTRIAELARGLLSDFPNDGVSVIVEVRIPPAGLHSWRVGFAEIFRIWPLPKFSREKRRKDGSIDREEVALGIDANGAWYPLYEAVFRPLTVCLAKGMEWTAPTPVEKSGLRPSTVLRHLEGERARRAEAAPQVLEPRAGVGRPMSPRQLQKYTEKLVQEARGMAEKNWSSRHPIKAEW